MIKTVAYFPSQCARNSGPIMSAVLDWFQASGIQTQENNWHSDAVVIWSVLWHGRMAQNQSVYEHYRKCGKPVIIVEVGALYRGKTWKIAVNNITAQGYYGHKENLDLDRPKKLGVSLAINLSTDPSILIAAQHGRSLQLAGINQEAWIKHTIEQLRQVTDRPICIRPHPRYRLDRTQLPRNIILEQPVLKPNTYDSFDIHFDHHAVINYNSGPGIQAAIAGTRPIVDATSLAFPVSVDIQDIEQPYTVDRQQWLTELCHTEYTFDELQRGTWLKRIEQALV